MQLQRELLPNFKTANEDWTQKVSSMVENVHTAPSYSFAHFCEEKEKEKSKKYFDEHFNLSEAFGELSGCECCSGTSWIPVSKANMKEPLRSLWVQAEVDSPAEDGFHLVPCPHCSPIQNGLEEHIVKVGNSFELKSKKSGKNLGKYTSKAGARKREKQVEYFKHLHEEEKTEKSVHTQWFPQKGAEFGALSGTTGIKSLLPWRLHEDWPLPGHPPDTGHQDYVSPQKGKGSFQKGMSEDIIQEMLPSDWIKTQSSKKQDQKKAEKSKNDPNKPKEKRDPNETPEDRKNKAKSVRKEKERIRQNKKLLPYEFISQKDADRSAGHLGIHGSHTTGNGIYKPGSSDYSLRDAVARKKSKQKMRGKFHEEKETGINSDSIRGNANDAYPLDKSNCHEDRDYLRPENPKTAGENLPEMVRKIKELAGNFPGPA